MSSSLATSIATAVTNNKWPILQNTAVVAQCYRIGRYIVDHVCKNILVNKELSFVLIVATNSGLGGGLVHVTRITICIPRLQVFGNVGDYVTEKRTDREKEESSQAEEVIQGG